MNIQQWLKQHTLSHRPTLDLELLLAERLGKNRAYLVAFADTILSDALLSQLSNDIEKLDSGYPLAYLLGKKDFWDMTLKVNEQTLIPRADTETLVEKMLTLFAPSTAANMIDLGTGSGAIAIALSREFPHASITATDLSEKALVIAKANAKQWQKAPIHFVQSSWLAAFTPKLFDAIISNPPYIDENDAHLAALRYEPIAALTAKNQGLADIAIIIEQSIQALKTNGWLLLEHGYQQGKSVRQQFQQSNHWQHITTCKDLSGNDRITIAQRIKTPN